MSGKALALGHDKKAEPVPLAPFLSRAYCAHNKIKAPGCDGVETLAAVIEEFRKCAANDKGLMAEARAESARLAKIPGQRCHISKTHGAFLNAALEGL